MSRVNMAEKVCLVTGGNSGIGKSVALGLAKMGATVVVVSRNKEKGETAVTDTVEKSGNKNVELIQADMSSQNSIHQLVNEFRARHEKLHLLINNAGVYLTKRSETEDGLESTFAVNHLGPFLLTSLLVDILKASAPSRIVNVTSDAAKRILYVATSPDLEGVTGKYFTKMHEVKSSQESYDDDSARRLWQISEQLTHLSS